VASESELSDVLSEFARTMVTDFPIQAILDHLVERIVEIMPVTAAGVTLISPGWSPLHSGVERGRLAVREAANRARRGAVPGGVPHGEAISVPDLSCEGRFPTFAAQANAVGLAAVFTFPLRLVSAG